jgi:hypothetical protein
MADDPHPLVADLRADLKDAVREPERGPGLAERLALGPQTIERPRELAVLAALLGERARPLPGRERRGRGVALRPISGPPISSWRRSSISFRRAGSAKAGTSCRPWRRCATASTLAERSAARRPALNQ